MGFLRALAASGFFLLGLSVATYSQGAAQRKTNTQARVIEGIPYQRVERGTASRRQTLDLYLPPSGRAKPPLLVFVHGGFWVLSDDALKIGPSLADELVAEGVAVALVRYRLGPQHRHPAQARDVAAAVAYLVREADRYGYDAKRLYLAGHSAGAHLASLVALDGRYLSAHRTAPNAMAGIIGISGIYDLSGRNEFSPEQTKAIRDIFGGDAGALKEASPVNHVKPGAPPFLLLSGSSDLPGFSIDTRRFSRALNGLGRQKTTPMVISGRDHFSMVRLNRTNNSVRDLLADFLKLKPLPAYLAGLVEAKRGWLESSPTTVPFWKHQELVRSYQIDRRFLYPLIAHYGLLKHELLQWPLEKFHAIDLFAYLGASPPEQVGKGDYLVFTNIRNEKQIWHKREIAPYDPVIVIGIDDERNLFEMGGFYRMQREYSWKTGPQPPAMARPVGAFIYFLKPPPPELNPQSWHFAMTEESFRLVEENPLAPLKDVPSKIYEVFTYRNGCVYCHSFSGIGSRSHHVAAASRAAHGGFALSLEDYPPEVLKAFLFDQAAVADKMGATPNVVEESEQQALYELIGQSRQKRHPQERQ